jgi:hypothetical protein
VKDSAGHERTIEEVRREAYKTARMMAPKDLFAALVEACGGVENLPESFTCCDCHGLWYDQCEKYR